MNLGVVFLLLAVSACFAAPIEEEASVRQRRSFLRVNNNPPPRWESHGRVDVGGVAKKQRGVGTIVGVKAGGAWTSPNRNTDVKAGLSYGKIFNGPAAGRHDLGAYLNFEHRFPGK